jgi:hypothetical protein
MGETGLLLASICAHRCPRRTNDEVTDERMVDTQEELRLIPFDKVIIVPDADTFFQDYMHWIM